MLLPMSYAFSAMLDAAQAKRTVPRSAALVARGALAPDLDSL